MEESEKVIRRWTAAHDGGQVLQPPKKPGYKNLTAAGLVAATLALTAAGVTLGLLLAWVWG